MSFQKVDTKSLAIPNAPGGKVETELQYDETTGNVRWVQTGIGAIGTSPIFENGSFTGSGKTLLQQGGISTQSQFEYIQQKIKGAANTSGGQKPQWLTGATPTSNPGGLLGAIVDPLSAISNISEQFDSKGDNFLKSLNILKYPREVLEEYQDVLRIIQFRYQPTMKGIFENPGQTLTQGIQRNTAKKDRLNTIYLPIPNGASDANNVSWGPEALNPLTGAAAGFVLSEPMKYAAGMAVGGATGGLLGSAGGGATAGAGMVGLYDVLKSGALGSPNAQTLTGTSIGSMILNKLGFEVSPETILSRAGGFVPNNNLELLFNAPGLRSFTFSYRLSPRSSQEATMVKQIIRSFKQGMAARKQSSTNGSTASYFLGTPNVFQLDYLSNGKPISGMNRFKTCALINFSVNYAPEGTHISYEDGQPASYQITMSFSELEPIYESDYNQSDSLNTDLSVNPIRPQDIGY